MAPHLRALAGRCRPLVLAILPLLIAALLFALFTQRTPPLPPAQVPTGVIHHKIGIHTRLAEEVDPVKIDRTLNMVADMGASWIVELFPWSYVETSPGHFDFAHADLVVNQAVAHHLQIIARLDMVPAWARPPHSSTRLLLPSEYGAYADYVAHFVARYRGKVTYVVIWNEPNLAFEWGFRHPDAAAYTALLRTVYPLAKAANPDVKIVSAGLAPTVEESANAWDDLSFLQQMYDAGAARSFDILGAHAFGFTRPATDPPAPSKLNFQRVTLERAVMVQNGDAAKPVLITEAGWNDAPRWTNAVRPAQRIAYTLDAYRMAARWPWLLAVNIFEFRLPARADNVDDYYTFVQPDFTPRRIFDEVKAYAHGRDPTRALGASP